MSSITPLLNAVKNLRFVKYVEHPRKTTLRLTNANDFVEFRKQELFIENHNGLQVLTKFLSHKDCPVKLFLLKHYMLDDGTNERLENYQTKNDFKVLMDAVKKNKSIQALKFIGELSNHQIKNLCEILPRVGDGRPLVYLKLSTNCVNDDQLEKILKQLQFSSLEYLHVTENKLSLKTGKTLKDILPKLLHLQNFLFEMNHPLSVYSNEIDNNLFMKSQTFRKDFEIAVHNNISLTYVRTDFDDQKTMKQFIHSKKVSFDIKDNAVETRANLEFWTNCNRDIQLLYQIFKNNRGIRQIGLSDKQAPQSIRNQNKTRLPVELRRYIHEFLPSSINNKGGISTFIDWTTNLRYAIMNIRQKVHVESPHAFVMQKESAVKKEKMIYFRANFPNMNREEMNFLLNINDRYIEVLLDKIYRYTRATGIYRKTKDAKPPVFRRLKLKSVDDESSSSTKRKRKDSTTETTKRRRT